MSRMFSFLASLFFLTVVSSQPCDETCLTALTVSRLSYCGEQSIRQFRCTDCNEFSLIGVYDPPSPESTQLVIVRDDDDVFVAFRGTMKTVQQWSSNLETGFHNWFSGRVHRGFHERFTEVRDRVISYVDDEQPQRVILTGHSMGGAVATLMASYIRYHRPGWRTHLITFGSPRVGDQRFAKFLDDQMGENALRVMNKYDMVTDLPPKLLGYRHTGRLVLCDGESICKQGKRLEENQGGALIALKRTVESLKNVKRWHLTYLGDPIGSGLYECES